MGWKTKLAIIGIIVALCLYVWSGWVATYTITGTVRDKYIDTGSDSNGNAESYYIVALSNGKNVEVNRNFWYGGSEYNPDTIYSSIKNGTTYEFTCWGWQFDWWIFYWYPNVIGANQIAAP